MLSLHDDDYRINEQMQISSLLYSNVHNVDRSFGSKSVPLLIEGDDHWSAQRVRKDIRRVVVHEPLLPFCSLMANRWTSRTLSVPVAWSSFIITSAYRTTSTDWTPLAFPTLHS